MGKHVGNELPVGVLLNDEPGYERKIHLGVLSYRGDKKYDKICYNEAD